MHFPLQNIDSLINTLQSFVNLSRFVHFAFIFLCFLGIIVGIQIFLVLVDFVFRGLNWDLVFFVQGIKGLLGYLYNVLLDLLLKLLGVEVPLRVYELLNHLKIVGLHVVFSNEFSVVDNVKEKTLGQVHENVCDFQCVFLAIDFLLVSDNCFVNERGILVLSFVH